jgi:hypothetical protein
MKTATMVLLLIASCALVARGQQVINVQFTDTYAQEDLNGQASSSSIAPLSYTGTTWTQAGGYGVTITGTDVPYSDDTSSTISFSLAGGADIANNDGSAPLPIFREVEYSGSDLTLTISGLQDGQAYNLAMDAAFNGGDGSAFSIGSSTLQDTGNNSGSSFVSGTNYVEFESVLPTDNSIVVTIAPNGTGQNFANINGFQIEEAPEPGTWAMMLGGLGVLAFFLRRRLTA